jgi:hypothetical protein
VASYEFMQGRRARPLRPFPVAEHTSGQQPGKMAVFPEEMLECIFAHLEPIRIPTPGGVQFECDDHMQSKALASICRANKACNRIAYPYPYRTIHLTGFSSKPRRLLRSLLQNSKLAPEVQILRISGRVPGTGVHTGATLGGTLKARLTRIYDCWPILS